MVKRVLISVIIFLLLVLPIITAVSVEMKDNFSQGETLLAKVSGNFLKPLTEDNIFLYRKNLQIRVPSEFQIKMLDGNYYLYTQLIGKSENNYSLVIRDASYATTLGEKSSQDIIKNFTIINQTTDFSVEPGFIETENNFIIKVKNLQDKTITINILTDKNSEQINSSEEKKGFFDSLFGISKSDENSSENKNYDKSVILIAGEEKEIEFSDFDSRKNELKLITLSTENTSYEIPVYVLATDLPTENIIQEKNIHLSRNNFNLQIYPNETLTEKINITNNAGEKLNLKIDVAHSIDKIVLVVPEEITLEDNQTKEIEIKINMNETEQDNFAKNSSSEKNYYGLILFGDDEEIYASSEMNLTFIQINSTKKIIEEKSCSELNGMICNETQKCSGDSTYTKDGNKTITCCKALCDDIKPSSFWKIIGWTIIILIAIFLLWFFTKKYRGAKGEVNLLEVAKGKK